MNEYHDINPGPGDPGPAGSSSGLGPVKLFRDNVPRHELGGLYREIWRLAWPTFLAQGLNSGVGFLSAVIVSKLGEEAFNSVNVGLMVFFIIVTLIASIGVGTTSLVAQYWGAGERKKAGEILQQSLMFGIMLCVLISLAGIPVSHILYRVIGANDETVEQGSRFMFWLVVAVPVIAPGFFFSSALRGAGDTRTPMVVSMVMGVLSLALSYGLVLGKLGMPKLGILGAALAIDGSFLVFSGIFLVLFLTNQTILKLPRRGWRPDFRVGYRIFRIGVPSAMEWILIQLGILLYVKVVYNYGDTVTAGYFAGTRVLFLVQTPAFGFQTAATTLVGQRVGARDYPMAESAFRHCAMLALLFMAYMGILAVIAVQPNVLYLFFGSLEAESISHARQYIMLLAFVMPLMGVSFTIAGGLRGAGETVVPLAGSILGVYGGRLALAFALYYLFEPPVIVVWCSMFPDLALRILVMATWIRTGRWKAGKTNKAPKTKEPPTLAESEAALKSGTASGTPRGDNEYPGGKTR